MTDWRTIGDTTLEAYIAEFKRLDSPMLGEAPAIYAAACPHSCLCIAMMWVEQKYATISSIPAHYLNPLSQTRPGASVNDGVNRWMRFTSYAQAVAFWRERLTSETGPYADTVTLEDLIHVYAPSFDGNNEALYVDHIERICAYLPKADGTPPTEPPPVPTYPTYPVLVTENPRKELLVVSPVPIVQKILPSWKSNQRPGTKLTNARYWVQHETGNPRPYTGALNHYNYLMGLTTENVSFHFATDDKVIIQMVPLDEVTWQAADGNGPGNHASWSNEGCINSDGNETVMRRNCEWLAAGVIEGMAGLGYGGKPELADIKRHWDFNAGNAPSERHHCPDHMMNDGYWPTFQANVMKIMAGEVAPGVSYAPAIVHPDLDLESWDGHDKVVNGTHFFACKRTLVARTTTKRLQVAATTAREIGPPLKRGDEAAILYVFQATKGGQRYALTEWGTRLRLSHFEPYIAFTVPKA